MKVARWIAGGIAILLAGAYACLLLVYRADLVTRNYQTLDDARDDQLFERGWLPDILPPSARNIRTTNDVDINTSAGEFRFSAADYQAFASRLRPYASPPSPFSDLDQHVQKMHRRGYQSGVFSDDFSTWLFICEPKVAYCEYTMWMNRE